MRHARCNKKFARGIDCTRDSSLGLNDYETYTMGPLPGHANPDNAVRMRALPSDVPGFSGPLGPRFRLTDI